MKIWGTRISGRNKRKTMYEDQRTASVDGEKGENGEDKFLKIIWIDYNGPCGLGK